MEKYIRFFIICRCTIDLSYLYLHLEYLQYSRSVYDIKYIIQQSRANFISKHRLRRGIEFSHRQ